MPMYEYLCEANGRTIEVVHPMAERFSTWGELCAYKGMELGDTPADAAVKRLVGAGNAHNAPTTLSKRQKAWGEASKSINSGPMAMPPRTKNF